MSLPTFQRLADIAQWYEYHKREPKDLAGRVKFLEDVVFELIEMFIFVCEDIKKIEGTKERPKLLVPTKLRIDGDLRSLDK